MTLLKGIIKFLFGLIDNLVGFLITAAIITGLFLTYTYFNKESNVDSGRVKTTAERKIEASVNNFGDSIVQVVNENEYVITTKEEIEKEKKNLKENQDESIIIGVLDFLIHGIEDLEEDLDSAEVKIDKMKGKPYKERPGQTWYEN